MQKRLLFLITLLLAMTTTVMAQVTTSGISGKVVSQGEDVIGATITATHQPSGTVYRAVTNIDGRYTIQGMRVGGPYKVTIAYIGQKTKTFDNVTLRLGETEDLSCSLQDDTKELQEVVVKGSAGVNATKTGAAQSITSMLSALKARCPLCSPPIPPVRSSGPATPSHPPRSMPIPWCATATVSLPWPATSS